MSSFANTALAEPVSPELVLVSPELRTAAIAELRRTDERTHEAVRSPESAAPVEALSALPQPKSSLLIQAVFYAAWQLFTGALFGLAALAAITAVIAVLTLVTQ